MLQPRASFHRLVSMLCGAVASAVVVAAGTPAVANEGSLPDGREVAEKVNARDDGATLESLTTIELIDRRGTKITREIRVFRKYFGPDRKTSIFFTGPKNVRGTAFLTHDFGDSSHEDDQWLYLPALRKVRRVSASDRGDYFLGTDFTYEDLKNGTKLSLDSFEWSVTGKEEFAGIPCLTLAGVAVDERTAEELGYGRIQVRIDPKIWMPREFVAWDTTGNLLKTVSLNDVRQVDGIWQPHLLEVQNHKTQHRTIFRLLNIVVNRDLPDRLFEQQNLRRGL